MQVVAHLSPPLLSHLRVVLGREHRLTAVEGWSGMEYVIRRTPADVAIVDPGAGGIIRVAEVIDLARRYPSLPLVLYTMLAPQTLRAVVELAKEGVHQVVLHRFDDEPRRFLELLEQQPGVALSDELLVLLAGPLAALPSALARAIEQMVQRPGRFAAAADLAAAAGMPRRTMYRVLAGAGFASPGELVRGARLLRGYAYLHDAGHSTEDVAVKLGYSSRQLFARHVREVFGVRPSELRRALSGRECIERLAQALVERRQDGGAPMPRRDS